MRRRSRKRSGMGGGRLRRNEEPGRTLPTQQGGGRATAVPIFELFREFTRLDLSSRLVHSPYFGSGGSQSPRCRGRLSPFPPVPPDAPSATASQAVVPGERIPRPPTRTRFLDTSGGLGHHPPT